MARRSNGKGVTNRLGLAYKDVVRHLFEVGEVEKDLPEGGPARGRGFRPQGLAPGGHVRATRAPSVPEGALLLLLLPFARDTPAEPHPDPDQGRE